MRGVGTRRPGEVDGEGPRSLGEFEFLRVGRRPLVAGGKVEQLERARAGVAAAAAAPFRRRRCLAPSPAPPTAGGLRRAHVVAHPVRVVGERRRRAARDRVHLVGAEPLHEQRVVAVVRRVGVGHPSSVRRQVGGVDALPSTVVADVEDLESGIGLRGRLGRGPGTTSALCRSGCGSGDNERQQQRESRRRAGGATHGRLRKRAEGGDGDGGGGCDRQANIMEPGTRAFKPGDSRIAQRRRWSRSGVYSREVGRDEPFCGSV